MSFIGEMVRIPRKIAGEISRLRQTVHRWGIRIASSSPGVYQLRSEPVDYQLARELYDNTNDAYKLGAAFAKPVINTTVGFVGIPRFVSEDEDAQAVLDEFFGEHSSLMQMTHLGGLRDGDCWVWLTREESEENSALYPEAVGGRLVYNIIPPEMIAQDKLKRHPITGEIIEYVLESSCGWIDERGNLRKCKVQERINRDARITTIIEGDNPGIEEGERENPWGFIPIVQFSNERDPGSAFGKSELEVIEPFIKAYHDVMLHAIQGSKLHSTPKLKLHLKDVDTFLSVNFGITDLAEFMRKGGELKIDGREAFIFTQDGEDADFAEVRSATGDAKELLQLLFWCIVDASQTPEFAFGTHTPSSLASVKEQMPVLIKKIDRKREQFADSWKRLARMVLAMESMASGKKFATHAVELVWDEVDPRGDKEVAETIEVLVRALTTAVNNQIMSHEAAVSFLAKYVETMNDYESDDPEVMGEKDRIVQDMLRRSQLEDAQLAEDEQKMIEQVLAEIQKSQNRGRDGDA